MKQCEQSCVDVGPLVVGTVCYRHLTLVNTSNCGIYYRLLVEQTVNGPYTDDQRTFDNTLGWLCFHVLWPISYASFEVDFVFNEVLMSV